jgi:hypothetical protein
MDPKYPSTKTHAAMFLSRSRIHLFESEVSGQVIRRDYNDHKAQQLFLVLAELLLAETQLDSWFVDLGFAGCQGDDNSIGGIPCLEVEES